MKSGARNACLKYNRIISIVPWARQNETVITIMNSVAPTALWLVVVYFLAEVPHCVLHRLPIVFRSSGAVFKPEKLRI